MAVILPLGLSIDSSTSDLPFLQCFSGGDPAPDDVLLQDLWLDPHHLSCPLPSPAADPFSAAACLSDLYDPRGELDACGLSGLHFLRANPVPSNFLETQFLSELAAFPFQVEKAEVAAALQTSPPALAPGLPETGGYIGGFPTSRPGGERPSAQSVAARQRRKRISEKTHELGQLVPGGNRMNTAEMLQSAFKYVKFLQAQVAMLGVICSLQPEQQAVVPQLLPPLLCSPAMQEKLTSEEKCVVPTSVLRALLEDKEIKSHPSICSDLRSLLTPSLIRS